MFDRNGLFSCLIWTPFISLPPPAVGTAIGRGEVDSADVMEKQKERLLALGLLLRHFLYHYFYLHRGMTSLL